MVDYWEVLKVAPWVVLTASYLAVPTVALKVVDWVA
jgi:hypothetical protein